MTDVIHIMSVSDEYAYMNLWRFMFTERTTKDYYDIFILKNNKYKLKE